MEVLMSLFPIVLLIIPSIIINSIISKRKGKNQINYILLSFIPLVGLYLTMYLISFLDKDVQEKINKIYERT